MTTIVSSEKSFVFIHVPKTAGTSITKILSKYADYPLTNAKYLRNIIAIFNHWSKQYIWFGKYTMPLHANAEYIKKAYQKDFSDYYKFSFVRNPWSRMVSLYNFFKARFTRPYMLQTDKMSFPEFVEFWSQTNPGNQVDMFFWQNETTLDMSYIAKVENIQEHFDVITKNINIPQILLPHVNQSKKTDYRTYYDDYTIELVAKTYQKDIEFLDYTFDK